MSNIVYCHWQQEAWDRGLRVIRGRYVQCENCGECWECESCAFETLNHECKEAEA